MESTKSHGVLTLAFGRPRYIEMAKSLGRSLALHAPDLPRAVVTDATDTELDRLFTHTIRYRSEFGSNVRQKVHLDKYSPFDRTLFIDSDSLAVRGLDSFWSAFTDVPFGACSCRVLRAGEKDEYLDVDLMLRLFGLTGLPKFNGGIYYFDNSPAAAALFATARDLMSRGEELGFSDFRGDGPADEALYSVAMAIHGLTGKDMGLGGMWTPIQRESPMVVDIPAGVCRFVKRGRKLNPDIIHFATFTQSYSYLRECLKLKHLDDGREGISAAEQLMMGSMALSGWTSKKFKRLRQRFGKGIKPATGSAATPVTR
jgi:hypothetical protein